MLKKGTKLNSILTGSCPKCQEESMYVVKNPYLLNTLYKMNENCSHCKLHYQIEPSFFYGAMYVSYGVSIMFGVPIFIIMKLILNASLGETFISVIIGLVALMPIIARLSRNIYINMFISYDKDWDKSS